MDLTFYHKLRQGARGAVPMRRALWRLAGPDRVRYLNGQVTNDISRLGVGKALYAAVTSAKGRMVGDIFVGATEDALYVDAALELRDTLAPRLEKYLIADDAAWEDLTEAWSLTHVFGAEHPALPDADIGAGGSAPHHGSVSRDSVVAVLSEQPGPPPRERISSDIVDDRAMATAEAIDAAIADSPADPADPTAVRSEGESDERGADADADAENDGDGDDDGGGNLPTAANLPAALASARFGLAGWDVWLPGHVADAAARAKFSFGPEVPENVVETLRIEHGLAKWGVDMDESNLPPESLLEQRAISYTKGCYVGQEIIARLKSVGQVNKRLCVLACTLAGAESPAPESLPGATLSVGDRNAGRITSAVYSPEAGRVICLGYVNRAFEGDVVLLSSTGHSFTIKPPLLTDIKI